MRSDIRSALIRNLRTLLTILPSLLLIGACGNGGGGGNPPPDGPFITDFRADASTHYVGESARLTATFGNGTGRIEPDDIAVGSGQTITTPTLSQSIRYRLTVSDGTRSVSRDLDINVQYRGRMRTVAAPFSRAEHAARALSDGRVIIFGGEDTSSTLPDSIYAFDPRTETFAPFGRLSSGRVAFTEVALYDGNVLIFGGLTALTAAPQAEIIDTRTGAVTPTGTPQRVRYYAAATKLMDGRVLITGGLRNGGLPDDSAEIYDPATGLFELLPGTLSVARGDHSIVRINDRSFLIYGGVTTDNQPAPPELFDPMTATSMLLPAPETTSRYRHMAITMQDGSVWIFGGEDFAATPLSSVQRFYPASSSFAQTLQMATPRTYAALQRLADGRLLIAGGLTTDSSTSVTDTSEMFSLDGQRQDGATMNVGRQMHTITALASGKLLIFGGLDQNRTPLASAEIFE